MTSSQFTAGWAIYLTGVLACLLALRLVTGTINPRLRRMLLTGLAALLLIPWWHSADINLLMPAFWVMLYDGLSDGFPAMARAGLPLVSGTGIFALLAVSMPVKNTPAKKSASNKPTKQQGQPRQRQEPAV